jgi:hypothetical protein
MSMGASKRERTAHGTELRVEAHKGEWVKARMAEREAALLGT